MNKKNILYVGSSGTSGYAISTKNFVFNNVMGGNNVTYIPIDVDNTQKVDTDPVSLLSMSCINKFYDHYDYFICNFIPSLFEPKYHDVKKLLNNPNCKKVLQTVWETTRISDEWLPYLNNPLCDEIWLPSSFNKLVFEESGVSTPIKIKRYVSYNIINTVDKKDVEIPPHFKYGDGDVTKTFNFYYIGTWNERKNNINTLRSFCETFTKNDDVSFLIKSNYYMYDDSHSKQIRTELETVLTEYPNHPTVLLFVDNYPLSVLNSIHNLGDCYFLLHRGEGLGISSYDAYLNHKPVIVTKFGGQSEYFSDDYPYFVDYKLTNVSKTFPFPFYQHDHQWAEPDYEHARCLLKSVYEKYR